MARVTRKKPNYKKFNSGTEFMTRPVRNNVITDPRVLELITKRLDSLEAILCYPQPRRRAGSRT